MMGFLSSLFLMMWVRRVLSVGDVIFLVFCIFCCRGWVLWI